MSNKRPYTNVTFTKRVDHEAGRHRPPRAGSEPAVCELCGAVYSNRRWTLAGADHGAHEPRHWRPARFTTCPACKQEQSGVPCGYVIVEGAFVGPHRDEIERLLRNEEKRTAEDNPTARIMSLKENGAARLVLSTTTEHLAQRLGHALEKAYAGSVKYDFSHENKLTRVTWHRD